MIWPLAQYYKLGKVISHEQAATIIGNHFGNIQDKLLNILQLKKQASSQDGSVDLLLAGIEQKTKEIDLVPFKGAIDLSKNKKVPALCASAFFNPAVFTFFRFQPDP